MRKRNKFVQKREKNPEKHIFFVETVNLLDVCTYNYIYGLSFHGDCKDFNDYGGKNMRIILDTDKKTITVPWNYQQKLEEYNKLVLEISNDKTKCKTFTSYINDIWKECMENSDKCVMTGKKPAKKEK